MKIHPSRHGKLRMAVLRWIAVLCCLVTSLAFIYSTLSADLAVEVRLAMPWCHGPKKPPVNHHEILGWSFCFFFCNLSIFWISGSLRLCSVAFQLFCFYVSLLLSFSTFLLLCLFASLFLHCSAPSLLICFSVSPLFCSFFAYLLLCFSTVLLLCLFASLFLHCSAPPLLICFSASPLFRFSAFCFSAFPCFSAPSLLKPKPTLKPTQP